MGTFQLMAKISQGNALTTPLLQAGYTIENDGYGVLTCKAVYKCDNAVAATAIVRGASFVPDTRLKAHKVSVSYGALDVATITVDYIGLADTESSQHHMKLILALLALGILLAAVIFVLADGPGLLEIIDNPKF